MIPISDDNPTRITPWVTYALIAINILAYAVDKLGAVGPYGNLYNLYLVPQHLVTGDPVVWTFPARLGNAVVMVKQVYQGLDPRWLTIFTSMFMHGGLLHIGGNMLYLWIFGNNIEDTLGHFKFLVIYLTWGVLAALAHVFLAIESTVPTVGASGAIAGVLGAYLVLFPHARVHTLVPLGFFLTFMEIPAILVLGVWFLIQLTGLAGAGGQIGGGVAYGAHIGGFIAGVVIIYILGGRKLVARRRRHWHDDDYNDDRPYPFRPWR